MQYSLAALVFGMVGTAVGVGMAGQTPPRSHVPPGLSGDKAAAVQHELDHLAAQPHHPKGVAHPELNAAGQPQPAARTPGIDEVRQAPFPSREFLVVNRYQGPVRGTWYLVYAGAVKTPDGSIGAGAVRVLAVSDTGAIRTVGTYQQPSGTGPLKVVKVDGSEVSLATEAGQTFRFDLAALRFD